MITGATGVVGRRLVDGLLARAEVAGVTALGRRAMPEAPKFVSKIVDLQQVDTLAAAIPEGTAIAFCALGTTMKQAGSKEAFRAVDFDAVVRFGEAARSRAVERFLLVSSLGADPGSKTFYSRTKGEAEAALAALGFPQLTIVRPSLIDDQGARRDDRLGERLALPIARAVFSVVGRRHRYAPIAADVIARAMIALAFDRTDERVRFVESDRLQALGAPGP